MALRTKLEQKVNTCQKLSYQSEQNTSSGQGFSNPIDDSKAQKAQNTTFQKGAKLPCTKRLNPIDHSRS